MDSNGTIDTELLNLLFDRTENDVLVWSELENGCGYSVMVEDVKVYVNCCGRVRALYQDNERLVMPDKGIADLCIAIMRQKIRISSPRCNVFGIEVQAKWFLDFCNCHLFLVLCR